MLLFGCEKKCKRIRMLAANVSNVYASVFRNVECSGPKLISHFSVLSSTICFLHIRVKWDIVVLETHTVGNYWLPNRLKLNLKSRRPY